MKLDLAPPEADVVVGSLHDVFGLFVGFDMMHAPQTTVDVSTAALGASFGCKTVPGTGGSEASSNRQGLRCNFTLPLGR